MPHSPDTYGIAAYDYLRHLIADLEKTDPGLHQRVLASTIDSYGPTPRMGNRAIIQALKELR